MIVLHVASNEIVYLLLPCGKQYILYYANDFGHIILLTIIDQEKYLCNDTMLQINEFDKIVIYI